MEEKKNEFLEAVKEKYGEDLVANNYAKACDDFAKFISENNVKQIEEDDE